jgi:predicted metal-dependent phosphoesterase TrpH
MTIDLHTHSNRSDGTDSPTDLVEKAKAVGLAGIGLTDHDATVGWAEAQVAADRVGIRLVKGVEVSTRFHDASVHLLGYEFDPTDAALNAEFERVLGGRDDRLPFMLDKLAALGMPLTAEQVHEQNTEAVASGRPHVADAMVAAGYIADRDEAFRDWLTPGKPAYVDRYAADLFGAVRLLVAAGGKPVIAHAWARDSRNLMTPEVFAELAALGLAGIEVDHPDHSAADRAALAEIADSLDLAKTGSSDHHGLGKSAEFALGVNTTDPDQLERLLGS